MHIGEFINNYLLENQISQRQFAKRCGFSNGYISMLINNSNPKTGKPLTPSLTALLAISKTIGISLDELINNVDDMKVDISATKNLPIVNNSEFTNQHEINHMKIYRSLNSKGQQKADEYIMDLSENSKYVK